MTAEGVVSGFTEASLPENPEAFSPRTEKIAQALELATKAHAGQTRAAGEPYVTHSIAVAQILEGWGIIDEDFISASLLHDVVEDTSVTLDEIRAMFGADVAELVDGVSKFRSASGKTDDRETLKKVLVKSYIDPCVAVLKLADRLHNMRTLKDMPEKKTVAKSRETLDVYTRLAESLGIWEVKVELEDLAFRYTHPETYEEIAHAVESDPRLKPLFLEHWKSNLERIMVGEGFEGRVVTRKNGNFSLTEKSKKAAKQGKSLPGSFSQINDLVSFRVIVPTVDDCYRFLGAVHDDCGNLVDYSRFDEFIGANKRPNGYSALQTTLNVPQGATEIAIMTEEMEEFNHWGVVSLMRRGQNDLSQYNLKLIFTPTDEVRFLPKQATGVDFAYALSERLGAAAASLLVDGEPKELSTVVANASTVEVIVSDDARIAPHPEVLNYCLPETRQKIERQLIQAEGSKYIWKGKVTLEAVLETRGLLDLTDLGRPLTKLVYWYGCQNVEELYAKVGGGFLLPSEISSWLDKEGVTKESLGRTTVRVTGVDKPGILVDLSTWIHAEGGNIVKINHVVDETEKGDRYVLRLVLTDIQEQGETSLKAKLVHDDRFETWKVV